MSRRLLYGTILVGVLILCNLGLFGYLLFRSLSAQEIRRTMLETRTEAEDLARRIAGEVEREGTDLFTALIQEQETQTYIDRVLAKREIVETVKIFNSDGALVFENKREETQSDELPTFDPESPPPVETWVLRAEVPLEVAPYELVEVPVGDVGVFVIGISQLEMDRRVERLRMDLLRSATPIAILTVVVLLAAYLFILWLLRRSRRLEGRAQEAEQMAHVGTLASGLAHEIRSPLNSLNLNMQMLEEESHNGEGEQTGRLLTITRAEISRLENLVSDFLSYARPRALEKARIGAGELLARMHDLLVGQERFGTVDLEVVDQAGDVTIEVDIDQMSQLLLNLVQNGVAAAREADRAPALRLSVEREGAKAVFAVEDNGDGISPDERERVFEVFYSTRRGGTGLGLAIARRIALAHDAELSLHSCVGNGTIARLSIPVVTDAEKSTSSSLAGRPAAVG
ncbi:MAG: ATP-binding protein [Acidobacteriota bacterium]|nr:ATP-binding protein [Acidobacteriota bacterium]